MSILEYRYSAVVAVVVLQGMGSAAGALLYPSFAATLAALLLLPPFMSMGQRASQESVVVDRASKDFAKIYQVQTS